MLYKSLKVLSYMNYEDSLREYQKRISNPASITTALRIHPYSIQRQRRIIEEDYPLFCILLPQIVKKKDTIFLNSKKITESLDQLPKYARNYFIVSQLVTEIQSTNEIEGVKSTQKEIAEAYHSEKKKQRFLGIVNMYRQIIQSKMTIIEHPRQFREIYDGLVSEEIDEKDQLDGELFRNAPVYVASGDITIHQGDPDEKTISEDLSKLIVFMNDSSIPILIKAIMTHYFFEYIHPFYDGNGRMGRFLFSSYISRKLDILSGLSLSSAIINNKTKYEDAFIEASHPKNKGELTFFVMDLIDIISSSQQIMIEKLSVSIQKFNNVTEYLTNKKYEQVKSDILSLMFQNNLFDYSGSSLSNMEITEILKISRYKVDKAIKELEKTGSIEEASKNPLVYKLSNKLLEIID